MTRLLGIHGRIGAMLSSNGISYAYMSHYEPLSMSRRGLSNMILRIIDKSMFIKVWQIYCVFGSVIFSPLCKRKCITTSTYDKSPLQQEYFIPVTPNFEKYMCFQEGVCTNTQGRNHC